MQAALGSRAVVPLASLHSRPKKTVAKRLPIQQLAIRTRGQRLLAGLGENGTYDELRAYAAGRLTRIGLNSQAAPDLVNEAVLAVLWGLNGKRRGRHPREENLQDMHSFLNYLKTVIKSLATNMGRHQRCVTFVCLDDLKNPSERTACIPAFEMEAPIHPDRDPGLRDLGRALFSQLRLRAPARLRRIIKAWKRDFFWADTIQLNGGHRQYRAELRALARQILIEMEPTLWPRPEAAAVADRCAEFRLPAPSKTDGSAYNNSMKTNSSATGVKEPQFN